jgi:hypothetical protein
LHRRAWLAQRNVSVEDVDYVITARRGFEEVVLHLYSSSWPLTRRHANRPPLLQRDSELRASDVMGEYQRALSAGDADAIVATIEPDGYARNLLPPASSRHRAAARSTPVTHRVPPVQRSLSPYQVVLGELEVLRAGLVLEESNRPEED